MNRLTTASLCIAGLIGMSACMTPQQQPGSGAASASGPDLGPMGQIDRYCVKHTGTRLMVEDDRADKTRTFKDTCVAAGGRVYTREDIERTGETDIAAALRKLDPSIY